jgi:predicted metal-dependent enzyme (double-stranded beta helix superfamily)
MAFRERSRDALHVFDVDAFIDQCETARTDAEPRRTVREVLQRAMASPAAVADVLRPSEGGISLLHHTRELTIVHVVWAPGMQLYPHDHRMWAAIGIYAGQEDNSFYRRSMTDRRTLEESGGKTLRVGDLLLLGDDTIHAVANPTDRLTGAIHVYGGDFVNQPRSQWGPGTREERPYNMADVNHQFDEANRAWRGVTAD